MKNNKILIVIIVFLLLIITGLGGFIIGKGDLFSSNAPNTNLDNLPQDSDVEPESSQEISSDIREILQEKIKKYDYLNYLGRNLNSMDDLSDTEILRFVLVIDRNNSIQKTIKDNIKINRTINSAKIEEFLCPSDNIQLYSYEQATDTVKYFENHPGHGGTIDINSWIMATKYVNSSVKDNVYTIDVNLLFHESCSDICGPSSKFFDQYPKNGVNPIFIKDDISDDEVLEDNQIENYFIKYSGNLKTYTYTFVKENDQYLLTSFQMK